MRPIPHLGDGQTIKQLNSAHYEGVANSKAALPKRGSACCQSETTGKPSIVNSERRPSSLDTVKRNPFSRAQLSIDAKPSPLISGLSLAVPRSPR